MSEAPINILIYIKSIVSHAIEHAESTIPFSLALAIHHIHCAIEWLLRIILLSWGMKERDVFHPGVTFTKLIDMVKSKAREGNQQFVIDLIDKYSVYLERLNYLRNQIQHRLAIPDHKTVYEFASQGEEFIKHLIGNVFNVNYEELSPRIFIVTKNYRDMVEKIESLLREGKYIDCIKELRNALYDIMGEFTELTGDMFAYLIPQEKLVSRIADIINKEYPGSYANPEVRALAYDLRVMGLVMGSTLLPIMFFTEDERIRLFRAKSFLDEMIEAIGKGDLKRVLEYPNLDMRMREAIDALIMVMLKYERAKSLVERL